MAHGTGHAVAVVSCRCAWCELCAGLPSPLPSRPCRPEPVPHSPAACHTVSNSCSPRQALAILAGYPQHAGPHAVPHRPHTAHATAVYRTQRPNVPSAATSIPCRVDLVPYMSGRIPHVLLAHGSELWLAALAAAMTGVVAAMAGGRAAAGGASAAEAGSDRGQGWTGRWLPMRLPVEGVRSLAVGTERCRLWEGEREGK